MQQAEQGGRPQVMHDENAEGSYHRNALFLGGFMSKWILFVAIAAMLMLWVVPAPLISCDNAGTSPSLTVCASPPSIPMLALSANASPACAITVYGTINWVNDNSVIVLCTESARYGPASPPLMTKDYTCLVDDFSYFATELTMASWHATTGGTARAPIATVDRDQSTAYTANYTETNKAWLINLADGVFRACYPNPHMPGAVMKV